MTAIEEALCWAEQSLRAGDLPTAERIGRLVYSIQRQLETRGDEVTTTQIGEAVMDGLKAIDHVAYIRFASVYKDFSEPGDFAEIAGAVGEEEEQAPPPPRDKLL